MDIAYVAADGGPKKTLEALAARLPGRWLEPPFDLTKTRLLVCGTSDSAAGRTTEAQACEAACERGIPCVVVEDFPGNFTAASVGKPALLVVDSRFSADLARGKLADGDVPIEICPAIRYDALRRRLSELRTAVQASEGAVLWLGQPETGDSLETLRRLLPAFESCGTQVWFRAHPGDEGYFRGAYSGLPVKDLTSLSLDECYAHQPRLVVTQFSSAAIEAGFWGIPSLNVLFPDVGGRTLRAKKGYSVPPWCKESAAFVTTDSGEVTKVLAQALGSTAARAHVQERFDTYFRVSEEGVPRLLNVLYNQGFLSGPRQ